MTWGPGKSLPPALDAFPRSVRRFTTETLSRLTPLGRGRRPGDKGGGQKKGAARCGLKKVYRDVFDTEGSVVIGLVNRSRRPRLEERRSPGNVNDKDLGPSQKGLCERKSRV